MLCIFASLLGKPTHMERCPSWPKEHDWKSCRRHKRLEGSNPSLSASKDFVCGPLVKGLRHLPFTEVTGVRIPYGSFFIFPDMEA